MEKKCVVVGAGLAGSIIANALSDDFDVKVLEIGPKNTIRYPELSYDQLPLGDVKTFCLGQGGTTNLWHNGLIPIRQNDVACIAFRDILSDAERFANDAAKVLRSPSTSFLDDHQSLTSELSNLASRIANFPFGIDCLYYPKAHRPQTLNSNVSAYYNVSNITFHIAGRHVSNVEFSAGERQLSISADVVVICAGGLGSPRLVRKILAAANTDPNEVGRGFIDHPMGFVGKIRFPRDVAKDVAQFAMLHKPDHFARGIIRLKSECRKYTAGAYFRPSASIKNSLKIHKFKSRVGASSGLQRIRHALSPRILHPDVLTEIVSHIAGIQVPTRTYSVLFLGEQRRGENSVSYNGDITNVRWDISDEELKIYSSMLSDLVSQLSVVAQEMDFVPRITREWLWSAAHHSGTISLGTDDNSILDTDLRIRCTGNAYVCDGSVIQEHSYANTGLTIGQLALRLADQIRLTTKGI